MQCVFIVVMVILWIASNKLTTAKEPLLCHNKKDSIANSIANIQFIEEIAQLRASEFVYLRRNRKNEKLPALTILGEFFSGNEVYFKNTNIQKRGNTEVGDGRWIKHPIINLDFSDLFSLERQLQIINDMYRLPATTYPDLGLFATVIRNLYAKYHNQLVVILIHNYDDLVSNNVYDFTSISEVLQQFHNQLEEQRDLIRIVFVDGITTEYNVLGSKPNSFKELVLECFTHHSSSTQVIIPDALPTNQHSLRIDVTTNVVLQKLPLAEDLFKLIHQKSQFDENKLKLKHMCLQDPNMFNALQSFLADAYQMGNQMGNQTGYQMADSRNILSYFKCAVSSSKADLEVYKDAHTKLLYKNAPEPTSPTTKDGKWIPCDIEEDVEKYDAWIPHYDSLSASNGHIPVNLPTCFPPKQLQKLLTEITKTSKNWYLIVTCTHRRQCPLYVGDLRKQLKDIQQHNPEKYNSVEEIYQRFSVHMARSYKMMCVLHHKVHSFIDKVAQGSIKPLSEVLFTCVPSFYVSGEQLYFLNVLRSALNPDGEPIMCYTIKNKLEQWTTIPFDNSSRCITGDLRKISTTLLPTLMPPTSPAAQKN